MSKETKSSNLGDVGQALNMKEKIYEFLSKKGIRYIVLVWEKDTLPYVELWYIKYLNFHPLYAYTAVGKLDLGDALKEFAFLRKNPTAIMSVARAKVIEKPYMDEWAGIGGKMRPALCIKYKGVRGVKI